jgi:NMD protein affecting ribosome stability and mRNA decay
VLKPVKTTVSKLEPQIEVLDPDTYQSVPVENSKKLKLGEKVKVVKDKGLFYVL